MLFIFILQDKQINKSAVSWLPILVEYLVQLHLSLAYVLFDLVFLVVLHHLAICIYIM